MCMAVVRRMSVFVGARHSRDMCAAASSTSYLTLALV